MPNISPRLQSGAIITFEPNTGVKLSTIMLQYNPDSLTRSLKPQTVGDEPDRTEILRLKGPPIETLKCDLEIDATNQLAAADPTATSVGIQPQLAPALPPTRAAATTALRSTPIRSPAARLWSTSRAASFRSPRCTSPCRTTPWSNTTALTTSRIVSSPILCSSG